MIEWKPTIRLALATAVLAFGATAAAAQDFAEYGLVAREWTLTVHCGTDLQVNLALAAELELSRSQIIQGAVGNNDHVWVLLQYPPLFGALVGRQTESERDESCIVTTGLYIDP